ncbi:ParB/RepB/Spo0J family partition protein [Paludicola sp. MB14-C6]|uniref:ParB/RepB/Spo0J family partition protein n=1 Tax=Paludihabitans sp. MB14-C6 TaxID=3070656 RepID=UPI0027DE17AA|nr:ParB/RepB/Spo0J family partition protein [Paludicola sp. MB14-C6]WMJ24289.1 ParB/RepB/Spo0J family partition protein [Paludicola sp. MB14-C6]
MSSKFNTDYLKGLKKPTGESAKEDIISKSNFKSTKEIFDKADAMIDTIQLKKLIPFKEHPFRIRPGERLNELAESIKEQGILVPLIVRVHPEIRGSYEILAGHHRHVAASMVGLETLPCIIKNADDSTAALIVVESNKQRGFADMLPSEIAKALKLEYDALKSQGKRTDLLQELDEILAEENAYKCDNSGLDETSDPVGLKLDGTDLVANKNSMSLTNVKRYIRLTYLIAPLLEIVDEGKIAIRPAVDISFLKEKEQYDLADVLDTTEYKVDMKKAEKLKEYSNKGKLNTDTIILILSGAIFEVKEKKVNAVKLPIKKIQTYIPSSLSTSKYEEYIIKALEFYQKNITN